MPPKRKLDQQSHSDSDVEMADCSNNNKRSLNKKVHDQIIKNQNNRCANSPFTSAIGVKGYRCLLWILNNGIFDESGYEIDHIDEFCKGGKTDIVNSQALCPNCHSVKTKRFTKQKGIKFTSREIEDRRAIMDIDRQKKHKTQ